MARPYSEDLRGRVVETVMGGATCRVAAARYQVSVSFVVKLMQRWRGSGSVAARPVGEPDITLEELRRRLAGQGVLVGRSSIDRFLTSLGLTRKKRRSMPPSRSGQMSPKPERRGGRISRP
jgi:transposase